MEEEKFNLILSKLAELEEKINGLDKRVERFEKTEESFRVAGIPVVASEDVKKPDILQKSQAQIQNEKALSEETGGRWLGKIGIIAVILGVSFFLKWAFSNNYIGETGRVIIGLIAGAGFLVVGQYLRSKYLVYSNILSGGSIGIFYLTIFSAFSFYHLISQPTAFLFMIVITILAVVLSVLGGTMHLAAIGILGGFLTPVLLSTGVNNLTGLFSYVAVLDIGILAVAFFRHWVKLNYLGFWGTVFIFVGWFIRYYSESQIVPTFLFLSLFFVIYLLASSFHHLVRQEKTTGFDLFLITANAALYSFASYIILESHYHLVLGFFAVILALVYFLLSYIARLRSKEDTLLALYFSGLAVVFLTIAIPLELKGFWITFAWFVEALVIFAVSFKTNMPSMRVFGFLVLTAGLIRYFALEAYPRHGTVDYSIFLNKYFLTGLVAVIVSYGIAYLYHSAIDEMGGASNEREEAKRAIIAMVLLANILTVFATTLEIGSFYQKKTFEAERKYISEIEERRQMGITDYDDSVSRVIYQNQAENRTNLKNEKNTVVSVFWAFYAVLLIIIGFWKKVRVARMMGIVFFFVTAVKVFIDVWSLGMGYRIISFIAFGLIALSASFLYAKYKNKLQEVI